jgi:hypothetical protein
VVAAVAEEQEQPRVEAAAVVVEAAAVEAAEPRLQPAQPTTPAR